MTHFSFKLCPQCLKQTFHAHDYTSWIKTSSGWVWPFGIEPRANQREAGSGQADTDDVSISGITLTHSLITIRAISDHLHTKWSWQQVPVNLSKVLIWLLSDRHLRCNGGLSFDRMKKTDCSCVKYTPKSVFRKLSLSLGWFCLFW